LVASVPIALPAVMSVTRALGALALSKQKAIVSRLSAIDELAGVDILCSDKTGTLTQNKLTLSTPIPFDATKPEDIVMGAALATKADSEDAIDLAVLKAVPDAKALAQFKQTNLVSFDPVSKRTMTTVIDAQGKTWRYAKGAPQAISAPCKAASWTRRQRRPTTTRSKTSPSTGSARLASRIPATTGRPGSCSACFRFSTRHGPTRR